MKIQIRQTKSNFKNEFEIIYDNDTTHFAKTSWISKIFDCTMVDMNGNIILKTVYDMKTNFKNIIPLKWISGSPKLSMMCNVIDSNGEKGVFLLSKTGFLKSSYLISHKDMTLQGYVISKGNIKYIALYDAEKDVQVGLLVKLLDVDNNLDQYTLYLLDDSNCDPVVLSFFAVYYDNWNYGNHGEIALHQREINWEWAWSKYNNKYDPHWIANNFPIFKWSDPPKRK